METTKIETTELKSNVFYDKIYCIGLNTLVASVFPLLSLLYLNIYTISGKYPMAFYWEIIGIFLESSNKYLRYFPKHT